MLETIKKLCTPAYVYLVISVIAMIILMFQNGGNTTKYTVGCLNCNVPSTMMVFVAKVLYIVFWTFVLNTICKAGYKKVSWFLVLLPFVGFFLAVGALVLVQGSKLVRN
jgi:hypothetical protein